MSLRIVIPAESVFDDANGIFVDREERVLYLEHSLLSMSRWEAETKQCFASAQLDRKNFLLYIQCMCDDYISDEEAVKIERIYRQKIIDYMFDERFAKERKPRVAQQKASSNKKTHFLPTEEIYYTMFERGVPITCEKWHFSRLVSLLNTYSKNDKRSKSKGKKKPSLTNDQWNKMAQVNRSRLNNGS